MVTIDTIRTKKPLRTLHLRHRAFLWLGRLDLAVERWRTRQALLQLSDEHLHDVGLTRTDANREGSRGFWD